jgi:hypothetical protein
MKFKTRLIVLGLIWTAFAAGCTGFLGKSQTTPTGISPVNQTVTAIFSALITLTPPTPIIDPVTESQVESPTQTVLLPVKSPPAAADESTQTPVATEQLTPIDTEVIYPTARPGATVKAAHLNSPPVLDGIWSEWKTDIYPANFLTFGGENWTGEEDLGASYRIGWDEKFLYLAFKVGDDTYVQNSTGQEMYNGDCLELLLDTNVPVDFTNGQLNNDDFQLGISPGNPKPGKDTEAFLWFPRLVGGSKPSVKIAVVKEDWGYRVETAIPWEIFGVSPLPGEHFGFGLRVLDNDEPLKEIRQTIVSNDGGMKIADPTAWIDLELSR